MEILLLSSTEWETHWGTQHQVAWRLARSRRVLFLELPVSPLSGLTGFRPGAFRRQVRLWLRGPRRAGPEGLAIVAPPPVLPWRYQRLANRVNQRILLAFLRRAAGRLGFADPALITFQADSGALARGLRARGRIYYCTDDWSASGRWWQPAAAVARREAELVAACDAVVATSRGLQEKLVPLGVPVRLLLNGVDLELFERPGPWPEPPGAAGCPRPRIGFAGMMTRHSFDPALIAALARAHPELGFYLAGRVEGPGVDLSPLAALPNVVLPGFLPRAELPAAVAAMDVCLIPWTENQWVERAFSLKLFEYLALGKPVVAAWTREYEPFQDLVYLARGRDGFERGIAAALAEDDPTLPERRRALARRHGWQSRVEALLDLLGEVRGG